jgi:zinc transporter ZupT
MDFYSAHAPILILLFAVEVVGTVFGIWAMRSRPFSENFAALNAGVMVGVALFWIFPDMTRDSGIAHSTIALGVTVAFLYAFDRYICPVCPCCAHREHGQYERRSDEHASRSYNSLIPLVTAIFIHNLFDGWTASVAVSAGANLQSGITAGLLAHKMPEAIIFGFILRRASNGPTVPLVSAVVTSIAIPFGAVVHRGLGMLFEETILAASLALICGSFLFVGLHAFLRQRRFGGIWSALKPLMIGLLASALLEQVVSTSLARTR